MANVRIRRLLYKTLEKNRKKGNERPVQCDHHEKEIIPHVFFLNLKHGFKRKMDHQRMDRSIYWHRRMQNYWHYELDVEVHVDLDVRVFQLVVV